MKISIHGAGYVGLVSGACLSEIGHEVKCFDIDKETIKGLEMGEVPFYEPGLSEIISNNLKSKRLTFTDNIEEIILHSDIQIICVGTPSAKDGSTDLSQVLSSVRTICSKTKEDQIIVIKSTVPIGTSALLQTEIEKNTTLTDQNLTIELASNPEFLKEGDAINDFMKPDRIVIGANNRSTFDVLNSIYISFVKRSYRIIEMDIRSAELTKYASNVMLASRVSLMNEFSRIADEFQADIEVVREAVGMDKRIGNAFLYPGIGYGGSCFPKDVRSMAHSSRSAKIESPLIESIEETNELQRKFFITKIKDHFDGDLNGKKVGIWGFTFKPNTDDIRESPAIYIMQELSDLGAVITAYNPEVSKMARNRLKDLNIDILNNMYEAIRDTEAIIICAEWKSFWQPDFNKMKEIMKTPVIFDGRNIYDPETINRHGFQYYSIGRR